jgi:16S rRNA (guanine527-N7)-methyltransferase
VTEIDELIAGATALGVSLQPEQLDRLARFATLLRRWNAAFNLVSRRDVARLIPRHLLDALSLVSLLRGVRVLDLGTGAGLPGLPLAIACMQLRFTLIDRNQRRIRFVRHAALELGLTNVEAVAIDFKDFRAADLFDTVVSRAVTSPEALWQVADPLLAAGGQALLQVGGGANAVMASAANVEHIHIHIPGLTSSHQLLRVTRRTAVSEEADQ